MKLMLHKAVKLQTSLETEITLLLKDIQRKNGYWDDSGPREFDTGYQLIKLEKKHGELTALKKAIYVARVPIVEMLYDLEELLKMQNVISSMVQEEFDLEKRYEGQPQILPRKLNFSVKALEHTLKGISNSIAVLENAVEDFELETCVEVKPYSIPPYFPIVQFPT